MLSWNNHLNFGQMLRFQPNQIFSYVLVFSKDEFLERLSEMFAEQAAEFKKIDEIEGGEPTEFAEFGYGTLEKALSHSRALFECFEGYMMTDKVLPHLWPGGGGGRYMINGLDRIEVSMGGKQVLLEGRGWNGLDGEIPLDDWMNL